MIWMLAHRRASRGTGLALAIVLAVLAVPLLPEAGLAADQGLTLTVHLGYHDVIKAGQWMPIAVDVHNSGSDFRGTIEIQLQDSPAKGVPPNFFQPQGAAYLLPFTLPAGATKHVRTFVVSDVPGLPVTVRLVAGGRVLATQTASGASTANLLVGVLSDDPTAFDDFGALKFPGGTTPQVVHLTGADIPSEAVLLRGFDLLAIDNFPTGSLTASQRSAMEGYVAMGGGLLLGSGPTWQKTLNALPSSLVPLRPSGTTTASTSAVFGSGLELASSPESTGVAWLREGSRPLIMEKAFGTGLVTMATFDWDLDPVASSSVTRGLLRQIGVRSSLGSNQSGASPGIGGGGGFAFSTSGTASVTQRGNIFISALSNLPALDLPSLRLTGLLVLLYVLLVGPLNYLLLRRLGRRELAWVTVPLIAIVFAAGSYGVALGMKGRSIQGTQIAILHVSAGWDQAYQETYTGIFAPTRGDYAIDVSGRAPAIAPIATVYGGMGPGGGGTRVHPDEAQVDLLGMTAFTLRGFATESTMPAPTITASLQLTNGLLTGTVHNASTLTFTDAVVIAGDGYQVLNALKPGADEKINIKAQPISVFGAPPAFYGIYPNSRYSGGPSGGTREGDQRVAVMESLINNVAGPIYPRITPVLIGWTHDPLQTIRVNGASPALQAETAIVVPLAVTQLTSGAIPAGLVYGRLVDASGNVQLGPSGVFINGGSATYELTAPLASGRRIAGLGITSANPYGPKFAIAAPGGPGVVITGGAPAAGGSLPPSTLTTELWDWGTGRWVQVALADNATTTIPQRSIDPATGSVRVRLSAPAGSTAAMMGALSLAGTVQ